MSDAIYILVCYPCVNGHHGYGECKRDVPSPVVKDPSSLLPLNPEHEGIGDGINTYRTHINSGFVILADDSETSSKKKKTPSLKNLVDKYWTLV